VVLEPEGFDFRLFLETSLFFGAEIDDRLEPGILYVGEGLVARLARGRDVGAHAIVIITMPGFPASGVCPSALE
jgi:hypothetical protein